MPRTSPWLFFTLGGLGRLFFQVAILRGMQLPINVLHGDVPRLAVGENPFCPGDFAVLEFDSAACGDESHSSSTSHPSGMGRGFSSSNIANMPT